MGYPTTSSDEYYDKNTYGLSVFARILELKESEQGSLVLLFSGSVLFSDVKHVLSAAVSEGDRKDFLTAIKHALEQKATLVRENERWWTILGIGMNTNYSDFSNSPFHKNLHSTICFATCV